MENVLGVFYINLFLLLRETQGTFLDLHHKNLVGFLELKTWKCWGLFNTTALRTFSLSTSPHPAFDNLLKLSFWCDSLDSTMYDFLIATITIPHKYDVILVYFLIVLEVRCLNGSCWAEINESAGLPFFWRLCGRIFLVIFHLLKPTCITG